MRMKPQSSMCALRLRWLGGKHKRSHYTVQFILMKRKVLWATPVGLCQTNFASHWPHVGTAETNCHCENFGPRPQTLCLLWAVKLELKSLLIDMVWKSFLILTEWTSWLCCFRTRKLLSIWSSCFSFNRWSKSHRNNAKPPGNLASENDKEKSHRSNTNFNICVWNFCSMVCVFCFYASEPF